MKITGNSLILAILAFMGCNQGSFHTSQKNMTTSIRIGEVSPMTGAEATFGLSIHRGVEMAVKEINDSGGIQGRQIELIALDDRGKTEEAVMATENLITQYKVVAVIGEVGGILKRLATVSPEFQIH